MTEQLRVELIDDAIRIDVPGRFMLLLSGPPGPHQASDLADLLDAALEYHRRELVGAVERAADLRVGALEKGSDRQRAEAEAIAAMLNVMSRHRTAVERGAPS